MLVRPSDRPADDLDLSCLDVAVEAWRQSGGTSDPVDLFDQAVAVLRA